MFLKPYGCGGREQCSLYTGSSCDTVPCSNARVFWDDETELSDLEMAKQTFNMISVSIWVCTLFHAQTNCCFFVHLSISVTEASDLH